MRVLCIGEAMVEFAPAEGPTYGLSFAGDTFNTAWYLARLRPDWQVSFLSSIGQDPLSERFVSFVQAAGIGTDHLMRHPTRTLGAYMIELRDGERSFHYWRGQSAARTLADDPAALDRAFGDADVLCFSGITLAILEATGRDALLAALSGARANGATVVFDPNMRRRLWASDEVMCAAIMKGAAVADIILPSFDEDSAFFGDASPARTIARYRTAGEGDVVVKNGAGDVHFRVGGVTGAVTPDPAASIVDTTAAGDTFAGYLVAGLAEGMSPAAAMRLAAGAAALKVTRAGTADAIPARDEVDAFLAAQPSE